MMHLPQFLRSFLALAGVLTLLIFSPALGHEDGHLIDPDDQGREVFRGPHPDPEDIERRYREEEGIAEADIRLKIAYVTMDAPWRVEIRDDRVTQIPVLFQFVETRKNWRNLKILEIEITQETSDDKETLVYRDTHDGEPLVGSSSRFDLTNIRVVDGFGSISSAIDVVKDAITAEDPDRRWQVETVTDANRGWHIIYLIPLAQLANPVDSDPQKVVLWSRVRYKRLDTQDEQVYSVARRLEIDLDPDPLPSFQGWHQYDSHIHTVAEYSTDTRPTAIRKAIGGPTQMFLESAYALGMVRDRESLRDLVIATDHNCFYSDKEVPAYGPGSQGIDPINRTVTEPITHPEYTPHFSDKHGHCQLGHKEFENHMGVFGLSFGEEVSLKKKGPWYWPFGTLGSHLLTFSTRHFMGPFHGGKFLFWRDQENNNAIDHVLEKIAGETSFTQGFTYAAHPFSESYLARTFAPNWNEKQLKIATRGDYIHRSGSRVEEFAFKGFEAWNAKESRHITSNLADPDHNLRLMGNPGIDENWFRGNPNWDAGLNHALLRWHQYITESLSWSTQDDLSTRFIRKFFASGGTDAHGDFGRTTSVLGRGIAFLPKLLRYFKIFSISDNAFGKVRTVVDTTNVSRGTGMSYPQRALAAFAQGQSVVSDGPVLEFSIDANGHFDSNPDKMTWHRDVSFENQDGRIGGDGRMDGARSALVFERDPNVVYRYRWANSTYFGGPLDRIRIYKDTLGGDPRLESVTRNTGPAKMLQHAGELDPQSAPDSDGWRHEKMGELRRPGERDEGTITTLSAISLGGFTKRIATPPFDYRCYTNPVWLIPVNLLVHFTEDFDDRETIQSGQLQLTFALPISMDPLPYEVRLIPLDDEGNSTGRGHRMSARRVTGEINGWSDDRRHGVASARYTVINDDPIDIPASLIDGKFVVTLREPRDCHGNTLNSIAGIVTLARKDR